MPDGALLAERGLYPAFRPLRAYAEAPRLDAVLLIGDPALDFVFAAPPHRLWDLGQAWDELTGLPLVTAVWALRRQAPTHGLGERLRAARDRGLTQLEALIRPRPEYTLEFRREYLTRHIRFELGEVEKRGIAEFARLLRRHALGPVFEPRYVS